MAMSETGTTAGNLPAVVVDRELARRCGEAYGTERLAINFTDGNSGEAAKRARGWKNTKPLESAEQGAAIMGTALARNPIVILGPSRLVGIDVDGTAGRRLLRDELPTVNALPTVTVQTGNGFHLWFRRPRSCPEDFVKVQLAETVTVSSGGYFVTVPGRHPGGGHYSFVEGREPWTIPIATLPIAAVKRIMLLGHRDTHDLREKITTEPDFRVPIGSRRDLVFRLACMLRRWSANESFITLTCMAWNVAHCDPELTLEQVKMQVAGAMKMGGGQEVAVTRLHELVERATQR